VVRHRGLGSAGHRRPRGALQRRPPALRFPPSPLGPVPGSHRRVHRRHAGDRGVQRAAGGCGRGGAGRVAGGGCATVGQPPRALAPPYIYDAFGVFRVSLPQKIGQIQFKLPKRLQMHRSLRLNPHLRLEYRPQVVGRCWRCWCSATSWRATCTAPRPTATPGSRRRTPWPLRAPVRARPSCVHVVPPPLH
jgi:hypothetical protein